MTRARNAALLAWPLLAALAAACDPAPDAWTTYDEDPERIAAIGDLHGDFDKARAALRLAGAIDDRDAWIGGDLVVVQTGDICDRGPYDRAILDLFDRLEGEARAAGGAVHRTLGNHDLMNAAGAMTYVPPAGFAAFFDLWDQYGADPLLADYPAAERPRRGAMRPAEPYAGILSRADVARRIGRTVFLHGSLLPRHSLYGIERMSAETSAWLRGERAALPEAIGGVDGPVTSRAFGGDAAEIDCALAREALALAGAERMVIGHTVQAAGVNAVCGGVVYRIDTGMSAYYLDGPVEVLELGRDGARVLHE